MAKKFDDPSNYVRRKLRNGGYRLVHKQVLRWRKKAKKQGALALSEDIKKPRKSDLTRNFFAPEDDET